MLEGDHDLRWKKILFRVQSISRIKLPMEEWKKHENASLIQGKIGFEAKMVIFKEKWKLSFFVSENRLHAFPERENASLNLIQGKLVLKRKWLFWFLWFPFWVNPDLKNAKNKNNNFRFKTFSPESGKRFTL
jgi:hypothetical protein